MQKFLKKLVLGFATGVGFSIALVLVFILSMDLLVGQMYKETANAADEYLYRQYKPEDGKLVVENEKSEKDKDGIIITGVVKNTDDVKWSSISLELELFDKDGNFVHECSEYISQSVEPSQQENFKLKCKGCRKTTIPEFESYKLRVVSASSY